ncbi:MAG: selenium metabolism-associated LysR family transcriptional regulator [Thermodesulfobacteriota bacterium]|nr:selenium metabolism-associated LysR family transcriptional regulator [Thermodesulfobacteriota bacterium]
MKKRIPPRNLSIDFDLRQLEVFRKVVELSSISKAADEVFLAQASVSERIATLEKAVGTRLLDRLARQVVPTKAGEVLYKHAVLLLEMKKTASLELQDFLGVKRGEIHMGGSTIPGEYILPKVIGRFHEQYPFVSVNLAVADTSEIQDRVLAGDLELGVVGSKASHRSLISRELWKDELVLAVPAKHQWAEKGEISLRELAQEPFILREAGSGTLKIMEDYFEASGIKTSDSLHVVARFGTSTAVKEGIKAGIGVSILSLKALNTEIETGILKAITVKDISISRSFYLIRDKRRIFSPLCQAMLDFLLSTS